MGEQYSPRDDRSGVPHESRTHKLPPREETHEDLPRNEEEDVGYLQTVGSAVGVG